MSRRDARSISIEYARSLPHSLAFKRLAQDTEPPRSSMQGSISGDPDKPDQIEPEDKPLPGPEDSAIHSSGGASEITKVLTPKQPPDPAWLAKRVMCVGMCVFDIIHSVQRYPEIDTKERGTDGYWQRGGNASNCATVLRALGAKVEFLGTLSKSSAFGFLIDDCRQRGIVLKNCPGADQDPPLSTVVLASGKGTRTIIHSNPNFPILRYEHFAKVDLDKYNWIHFEARNPEETKKMMQSIITYNETHCPKIIISLDVEKLDKSLLELAELVDYCFLGQELARFLEWNDGQTAVRGLHSMLTSTPKPGIICTWGSEGTFCLDSDGNFSQCAVNRTENIVDTLGAGDTFCAATIYALLHLQLDLKHAVEYGNLIAGFKIQHRGFDAIHKYKRQSGATCTCKARRNCP